MGSDLEASPPSMKSFALALLLSPLPLVAQQPQLALQTVATGLNQPVDLVHAGDSRLFIVLQPGQIVIYDGTRILPTPFLDIRSLVLCCGERGLLGLAFHPRYAQNGFFFVYYTDRNGNITVARYSVSSSSRDRADAASGSIFLSIEHPGFSNHNGGELTFGPDGYLYIGTGDGGSGGDPPDNAQHLDRLLGKILRIDVDTLPYRIPPSNPYAGFFGVRGEIWAFGLRNPWRFSFDRETGDLWIGDVGQGLWEEVDFQPASSIGGENYGWRLMEGNHCYTPPANCYSPTLTLPVMEYSHDEGCSITGGFRYRGARFPHMRGIYFFGDFCNGTIWGGTQPQPNGPWLRQTMLATGIKNGLSSFGEDVNGELYFVNLAGTVYQIIDNSPVPPRRRAVKK